MPTTTSSDVPSARALVEEAAVPVSAALTELPALKRIVATKVIPRDIGADIAPGQSVFLPAALADEEIKAGRASDPDAKESAKSKS
jgi:hypothetical protein